EARAVMNAQPFDWQSCVDAFTSEHAGKLSKWRGYSIKFCRELHEQKLIGIYKHPYSHKDLCAFPVYGPQNNMVGPHYRMADGWRYHPAGTKATPFVIGKLTPGEPVHVFESTWDGLDYMDKSGARTGVVIARGSENAKRVAPLISGCSYCVVWTQNDEPGR